jgi:hypothetical protein
MIQCQIASGGKAKLLLTCGHLRQQVGPVVVMASSKSLAHAITLRRDWERCSFWAHPTNVRSCCTPSPYPSSSVSHRSCCSDIVTECANVGKVEVNNIVAVVKWYARVWPQRRIIVGGYDHTGRRRGLMRGVGMVGAGVAATTIGAVSEGAGTQGGMDTATAGRMKGAE